MSKATGRKPESFDALWAANERKLDAKYAAAIRRLEALQKKLTAMISMQEELNRVLLENKRRRKP